MLSKKCLDRWRVGEEPEDSQCGSSEYFIFTPTHADGHKFGFSAYVYENVCVCRRTVHG